MGALLYQTRNRLISVITLFVAFGANSPDAETNQTTTNQLQAHRPVDPPNTWHIYSRLNRINYIRPRHAGIALDSKRQKIYVFGSDTHDITPYSLDNAVYEFDLHTRQWEIHYQPAPLSSYRVDEFGRAVAGVQQLLPWAMHTYDNVIYDPLLDAILISADPKHNHQAKSVVSNVKTHPTWFYNVTSRSWYMLKNSKDVNPSFFAAGSAYDKRRETVVAYGKNGLWELGPKRKNWQYTGADVHHTIHFTMDYDTVNHKIAVFGNWRGSDVIWLYSPGKLPGDRGTWEKRTPQGASLPLDQHYPVAFSTKIGVFLLTPNNRSIIGGSKNGKTHAEVSKAVTYTYDVKTNILKKLDSAVLEPLSMNYMMVYSEQFDAFFLISGDEQKPLTVWILKLELDYSQYK